MTAADFFTDDRRNDTESKGKSTRIAKIRYEGEDDFNPWGD